MGTCGKFEYFRLWRIHGCLITLLCRLLEVAPPIAYRRGRRRDAFFTKSVLLSVAARILRIRIRHKYYIPTIYYNS